MFFCGEGGAELVMAPDVSGNNDVEDNMGFWEDSTETFPRLTSAAFGFMKNALSFICDCNRVSK
jgi:hypothetical protein